MASEPIAEPDRVVDTRDIEGEPFSDITAALDALGPDETLLVINPFEPEPLYDVLEDRGFAYDATQHASDEWHVTVTRA